MMPPDQITCPVCSQFDCVDKVSTIYMEGIGEKRIPLSKNPGEKNPDRARPRVTKIPVQELQRLSRKLAPPSSGKAAPTRPVHPDIVVTVFSCIAPLFLYGIWIQQRAGFVPVLILLAGVYGLYFFKRKAVIAKFEGQQTAKREAQARIERGIKTWMRLYYCARDEGVFLPGGRDLVPVDQMTGFLLQR
jgi:hypothetical protein